MINLGSNRWVVRPQLGVSHSRGNWTGELTGSVFICTFRPGLWLSLGTAYGWGGEAVVNGIAKNNYAGNWLSSLTFGFPIDR